MKKIYTFILSFAALIGAHAQSIEIYQEGSTVDISGTTVFGSGDQLEMKYYLGVKNVTSDPLDLTIMRTRIIELTDTKDYFCWGVSLQDGACYSEEAVSASSPRTAVDEFTFDAGVEGILYSYHKPYGNNGVAKYRYYVMSNGVALDSVDVQYNNVLSVSNNQPTTINVYPNPAYDMVNVQVDNIGSTGTMMIYDISGKKVMSSKIKNGKNQFNVEALTAGVYFYTIRNNQDIIETKKLLIQ